MRWLERPGPLSALIYTSVSLLAASVFLAVTLTSGDYSWVARLGGSAWILLLSLIILMPTVTPWVRKQMEGEKEATMWPFRKKKAAVEAGPTLVKDPVCGMEIDPAKAAATFGHEGVTYYFCAVSCKEAFEKEPARYL